MIGKTFKRSQDFIFKLPRIISSTSGLVNIPVYERNRDDYNH